MKMFDRGILLLTLIMAVAAIAVNIRPVSADACVAQLNYSLTPASYSDSNIVMNVPVSVNCPFIGDQVYAVGNVYDTFPFQNINRGSAKTMLSFAFGSNVYTGQLQFNLSPVVQGHSLVVSVYIYGNGQYSSPLTSVAETVQINANYLASNYLYNSYPYNNCYQYGNYNYNNCSYGYNYNNNYNYNNCGTADANGVTQCSGYLYQDSNGCVEIVATIYSPYAWIGASQQYYTLHNLPSSYQLGNWVTVTGQLQQGYNTSPTGAACPGNYINVSSMT